MKIQLKKTPEQIALVKDMASKNRVTAENAREALAVFIRPVIQEVINNASTTGLIYQDVEFDQNQEASIPLDTYYDQAAGLFTIWSQNMAGGLPSNFTHDVAELKVQTYNLDSAISLSTKYIEQSRLDVLSKALTRLANEVMLKQDFNGWMVILKTLANATTKGKQHVFRAGTAGVLQLEEFNKLLTRSRRINASFDNGTPDPSGANIKGVTDLFLSPEMMEQIRALAYQPVNTRQAGSGTSSIPATDALRDQIFRNGGAASLYDIDLHELNELGENFKYNQLFAKFAGATSYTKDDGTGGAVFAPATTELVVGFDRSREGLYRPVQTVDGGGQYSVENDEQWTNRSKRIGFFVSVNEGRICADSRIMSGCIV
jgi:hypothetical protein